MKTQLHYRLQLLRSKGVGYLSFRYLINEYGSAKRALEVRASKGLINYSAEKIQQEIIQTYAFGANFLCFDEDAYPERLNINNSLPILIYKGHISLLERPTLGVAGARKATALGLKTCNMFVSHLCKENYVIVSGMANGIDTIAHESALETSYLSHRGGTIGVITGGIDSIYPKQNKGLYDRMYKKGLIIAYQPFGSEIKKFQFSVRNQIIVSMSEQMLIIEAGKDSGTLSTAQYALRTNNIINIVPGSIWSYNYYGSNNLIKYKTNFINIVTEPIDIDSGVDFSFQDNINYGFAKDTNPTDYDLIFSLLSVTSTPIAEIISYSSLSPQVVLTILSKMELENKVIIEHQLVRKNITYSNPGVLYNMQETVILIKPDAFNKTNEIISMISNHYKDLEILQKMTLKLNNKFCENFYEEHKQKSFFGELCEYMTSGNITYLLIKGKDATTRMRILIGHTDPKKADKGTIRAIYGTDIGANAVHGSLKVEDAKREKLVIEDHIKNSN